MRSIPRSTPVSSSTPGSAQRSALLLPRVVFDVLGFEIFAALVGAVLVSELLVARSPLRVRRSWLWVSLALYAPAFAVWWLSLSGHSLCEPASLFQGHALWHVITALSPGALYLYFRDGDQGAGLADDA